ncbi:MAG TPA: tRNA threonylcarbamoyladenosine dehydratase [Candidatus Izemoplasmatales bacterium]|nr:tRNA threonylcarbamoyladenosine dehydratase [Candidatus Izemoplasmatales bacterium]
MRFNRLENLIGHDKLEMLKDKKIIIFGLGGVGSFAAEALVRSGVGHLVVVDYDLVDETNINRQLIALESTIGHQKTSVFKRRAHDINSHAHVDIINEKVDENNIQTILDDTYDFALDCIDDVNGKIEIIRFCQAIEIPLIISMGFANKFHPEMIQMSSLKKTSVCPLAKAMRKKIRTSKLSLDIPCVYSQEKPSDVLDHSILGSTAFCPSSAGLMMAAYVINQLLGNEGKL